MEVLMGIFVKACVAVVVGVICLTGLILYSKKKDREEAQSGEAGKNHTDSGHMTCYADEQPPGDEYESKSHYRAGASAYEQLHAYDHRAVLKWK